MNTDLFISYLRSKDVKLWIEREELSIDAPKGVLDADDVAQLRAHKSEIIRTLQRLGTASAAPPPLQPQVRGAVVPLSYAQQRLWTVDQMSNHSVAYHVPMVLKLRGPLHRAALQQTLDALVMRHEALRTTFRLACDAREPAQHIAPQASFALQFFDIAGLEIGKREAETLRHIHEERMQPFVLELGPLVRGRLVRLHDCEHVLMMTLHHIICDGWSMGILLRDIGALYGAFRCGYANPLQDVPIQYADYALWQRQWLGAASLQVQLDYWQERLRGAVALELPLDRPRKIAASYEGARHRAVLSKDARIALQSLATRNGATLYMVLLAAFQFTMARVTGQSDVVVATPIAGRHHRGTQEVVGFFVNMLAMRVQVDLDASFLQLLARVRESSLTAYAHQDLPFERVVAEMRHEERDGASLGRVVFTLENRREQQLSLSELNVDSLLQQRRTSKAELSLTIQQGTRGLVVAFDYATELFDLETIEALSRRFVKVVEQVIEDPTRTLRWFDLSLRAARYEVGRRLALLPRQRQLQRQLGSALAAEVGIGALTIIDGALDVELWRRALQQVVAHTAALRLQFSVAANSELLQRVQAPQTIDVPLLDFTAHADPQGAAQAWCEQPCGIDPCSGVPYRWALLKISATRALWFARYHRLVTDEIGVRLIGRRVLECVAAGGAGLTDDLESFTSYLATAAEYRYSPKFLRDQLHWSADTECSTASLSVVSSADHGGPRAAAAMLLSNTRAAAVLARCVQWDLELGQFVAAALALYVHKITARTTLSLGWHSDGRSGPTALVGPFAQCVPLQVAIDAQVTLASLVQRMRHQVQNAAAHARGYGMTGTTGSCFAVVLRVVESAAEAASERLVYSAREHELVVSMRRAADVLHLEFDASAHHFEHWEVVSHLERFAEFVVALATQAEPLTPVGSLSLLSAAERARVLALADGPRTLNDAQYPREQLLHQLFEAQVARTPLAIAVTYAERSLTYAELNRRANRLAHYLRGLGVGPDQLVALCTARSIETLLGMLGILKAGAAYLPLDTSYPSERLRYTLEDAHAAIVLTQGCSELQLPGAAARVISLDRDWALLEREGGSDADPRPPGLTARHLAYVIYTSGSTGRPKGVMVEHRNIVNYVWHAMRQFEIAEGDGSLIGTSFGFDLALTGLYPVLLSGKTVRLCREGQDIEELCSALQQCHNLATLKLTPSHLSSLQQVLPGAAIVGRVRSMVLGGEPLHSGILQEWQRHSPTTRIFNHYGPTETTVACVVYPVRGDERGPLPIGRPIANASIYILDADQQPVPLGVMGEIYAGGSSITRGYWNRPELTAQRYIADEFGAVAGARLYRTGDLGRWLPDGNIDCHGRNDDQVKIRGFRVELGEVEARLRRCAQVRDAIAVARDSAAGDKQLVAYVTSEGGAPLDGEGLRQELAATLPAYMVPAVIVSLPTLPLTLNGKVDRRALPDPVQVSAAPPDEPVGAIETLLARIWCEVLGLERIGRHDNFFAIGGSSFSAIQAIGQANRAGLKLAVSAIFEAQSVAALATLIDSAPTEVAELRREVAQAPQDGMISGAVPFTSAQLGALEHSETYGRRVAASIVLECRRPITVELLREALRQLALYHDALRLQGASSEGGWQQFICPADACDSSAVLQVEQLASSDAVGAAVLKVSERLTAAIDLTQPPLLRACLLECAQAGTAQLKQLLIVVAHHFVTDPISWLILVKDLQTIYEGLAAGRAVRLPIKGTSIQEWTQRLQAYANSPEADVEVKYWQAIPWHECAALPLDRPRDAPGDTPLVSVQLDALQTQQLQQLERQQAAQIDEILLSAIAGTLLRWADGTALSVSLYSNGRSSCFAGTDVSRTVGWFSTRVPLLLQLPAASDAISTLAEVKRQVRAIPNEGITYGVVRHVRRDALAHVARPALMLNHQGVMGGGAPDALFWPHFNNRQHAEMLRSANTPWSIVLLTNITAGCLHATLLSSVCQLATLQSLGEDFIASLRALACAAAQPPADENSEEAITCLT